LKNAAQSRFAMCIFSSDNYLSSCFHVRLAYFPGDVPVAVVRSNGRRLLECAMLRSHSGQAPQSLKEIAVLAGLPPETLARIQKHFAWRRYEPGEPIVDYLDTSNEVFFICAGEARASIYSVAGKAVIYCDLAPGEMFGELAAIDGAPRSMSIEARTSCVVASISAAAFWDILRSEPAVTDTLLRYFVTKIRQLTTRVYEFSALAVTNRIQAEVLRLARSAHRQGKTAHIIAAPTHAEIASRTSTHREAVTRELNRLSRIGIIERRGRALIVKDVDRLAAMVHEATGE
jgi:CRP/FNR family cyclic AMP-dependent transcriptional regulator